MSDCDSDLVEIQFYQAIIAGDLTKARQLIWKPKFNPNYYVEEAGQYLVFLAFTHHHTILEMLCVHPNINFNIKNWDGDTILHYLAKWGMDDIIKRLRKINIDINLTNNDDDTPLSLAIKHGHRSTIELLIEQHQARITEKDMIAYAHKFEGNYHNVTFFIALLSKVYNISYKSGYWSQDIKGMAQYLIACYPYYPAMGNILVKYVDLKQVDDYGNTILHYIISFNNNDLVTLLLNHGVDPTIKNQIDYTAEDLAEESDYFELCKTFENHQNSSMDVKEPDMVE